MANGTVKWFNAGKGYGIIKPEGGGGDVFMHIEDVQKRGLQTIDEGQKVKFRAVDTEGGKVSARNIEILTK